jgi:hypothetical protein
LPPLTVDVGSAGEVNEELTVDEVVTGPPSSEETANGNEGRDGFTTKKLTNDLLAEMRGNEMRGNEGRDGFTTKKPTNDLLAERRKSRQERQDDIKKLVTNVSGATSVRKHLKEVRVD